MGGTVDGTNPYNTAADSTDQTASDGADIGHAAAQQSVFDALRGDPDKANTGGGRFESHNGSGAAQQKSEPAPLPISPRINAPLSQAASASQAPPAAKPNPGQVRLAGATSSNTAATVPAEPRAGNASPKGYGQYDTAQQAAYDDTYRAVYEGDYRSLDKEPPPENYSPPPPSDFGDMFDPQQQLTQPTDEFQARQDQEIRSHAEEEARATADQVGLREQLQAQIASTTDPAKLAQLQQSYQQLKYAQISKDVYNEQSIRSTLPPGVRRVEDPAELAKLGLKESDLNKNGSSGYFAAAYHDSSTNTYIVANRGTEQAGNDWANNFAQGLGVYAPQYQQAVTVADKINQARDQGSFSGNIAFTGHSLGGGLAATQSLRTGLPATTFDAAGVSADTVKVYGRYNDSQITGYSNSDIVTKAVGDRRGQRKILTPVSLPGTQADGKLTLGKPNQAPNILTLHGMNYIISSILYDSAHGGPKTPLKLKYA